MEFCIGFRAKTGGFGDKKREPIIDPRGCDYRLIFDSIEE